MYANDFGEILDCLKKNEIIKSEMIELVKSKPIHGKAIENDNRCNLFRLILMDLINNKTLFEDTFTLVEENLPESESSHRGNAKVFPKGWSERLIRTQLSRFYNQAILMNLEKQGVEKCFVPHSSSEGNDSKCTSDLAGKENNVKYLLNKIINTYDNEIYDNEPKIPNHPFCTHVVKPL